MQRIRVIVDITGGFELVFQMQMNDVRFLVGLMLERAGDEGACTRFDDGARLHGGDLGVSSMARRNSCHTVARNVKLIAK